MGASSAARYDLNQKALSLLNYGVAASPVVIYDGTLVAFDSSGYLNPGADASGFHFAGVAKPGIAFGASVAGTTAGTIKCPVAPPSAIGSLEVNATSADITWLGKPCYMADDNSVALTSGNTVPSIGTIREIVSSTRVVVAFLP